jgi:RNA-directed DNA polymerase
MNDMTSAKPYSIAKRTVWEAYQQVKANRGSAGIDDETIAMFEQNLPKNLYKLWNRMSSGSYFPPPVKQVQIPKGSGGFRRLGIPTVSDRIAQTAVKLIIEPIIDPVFHPDSYGYRPGKSAKQAIAVTKTRCWQYDWVVEFDIKAAFDQIDHALLMKAVRTHIKENWILLYIERWLTAPFETDEGVRILRERGTPQGGVVSPILMNLFMHYAFDCWMKRTHLHCPFARYADDAVVHCRSQKQAEVVMQSIASRLEACGLAMHPEKSRIVYCKDSGRTGNYPHVQFTFLGFTFRPRDARNKQGRIFLGNHLKTGHTLSVQNRPMGLAEDVIVFTLPERAFARRDSRRCCYGLFSSLLDACYGCSRSAGVAPCGVIQGRGRGAGSEGIGIRDPLWFARWAGRQRVSCLYQYS